MDQTLLLSWSEAQARRKGSAYRFASRIALLLESAIALVALVAPLWLAARLGGFNVSDSLAPWIRAWACLILLLNLVILPAPSDAPRRRWLNLLAVGGRFVLALAYALIGLLWLALLEAVLFLVLAFTLYRYAIAVLMSRP